MIRPGICSLTLAKKNVSEVIAIAKSAGLDGIEWWGKDHVPHGDTAIAAKVRILTCSAGLEVSSYGSYYRAGVSESEGLDFSSVLDTAIALGAPTIRIWAGNRNYADADESFISQVISDAMRIADMAAKAGLTVTFEFHGGTLTDTSDNAIKFASMVEHPAVFFSWQPPHGFSTAHCLSGLEGLLPRLSTIHVFHWTLSGEGGHVRHPLASGIDRWEKYVDAIRTTGLNHFALLEFVKDDSPEQVIKDAVTLRKLLCQ
ncbi:MAG: TIM barrel protein [Victivallales bacterium]